MSAGPERSRDPVVSPREQIPERADSVRHHLVRFVRLLLRMFFRQIEVSGLENVPRDRGGVYVAWHPNGLLDPGLIVAYSPQPVIFGARHTLFDWPLLGWLMKALGTVPIYRPQEGAGEAGEEARRVANLRSLDELAAAVLEGRWAALFPEGFSHDQPHLSVLRPGAARLYLRVRRLTPEGAIPPALVPVGLHYNRKHLFGSVAYVEFHPPIELSDELVEPTDDEDELGAKERALTDRIDEVLTDVVQATEDWETHRLMHRLRKIVRAEQAARLRKVTTPPSMRERTTGFGMVREAYERGLKLQPERVLALRRRVERHDRALHALRLEDHELDGASDRAAPLRALSLVGQAALIYVLLPPLLVLGYLVNIPVALALGALVRRIGTQKKDEASLKLLLGAVIFPAVWLLVALGAAWGVVTLDAAHPLIPSSPWPTAIVTFLLCSVGGWLGVRYLRVAAELGRAFRARLTRASRRKSVRRLMTERAELYDEVMQVADDLALPGSARAEAAAR